MRHLYLSELRDFINECGIPKDQLKQFKIATSKSSKSVPEDLHHTIKLLEKSKYVYLYVSRARGGSRKTDIMGIRLYPKDMYVVHNDCPLEEVFAGCTELNSVDAMWFWNFLDDENIEPEAGHVYPKYPRECLEQLLAPTAANVDDIKNQESADSFIEKEKPAKPEKAKKSTKIKADVTPTAEKKTRRTRKKAAAGNVTNNNPAEPTVAPNPDVHPVLSINYDPEMLPAALVERYIEFYGLNPVALEAEHGIQAIIKRMYEQQGSEASLETAVGLYNLLGAHSGLATQYNELYSAYKSQTDFMEKMSNDYANLNEKYYSHKAYFTKHQTKIIGRLGVPYYNVEIIHDNGSGYPQLVKRYREYNAEKLTIGSILDKCGIYVTSIEPKPQK